jgi:hypothetical protein
MSDRQTSNYTVGTIASELTELEQLNLKVAAIAGWTDIWKPQSSRRLFVGKNKKQLGLGNIIPEYTRDLNAIVAAFDALGLDWNIGRDCNAYNCSSIKGDVFGFNDTYGETPAIALCKLLIELAPCLPKSELEIQVIDDDLEID